MKTDLKRIDLRWLRASLASSGSFFDKSDAPKEANLTETIIAPKVRELIEKLGAATKRHKGLVVALRSAEADQLAHEEQLGILRIRIEERHTELARSGPLPPEEPFEEETLLTKLTSKGRFHAARVRLCQESVASSQTEIQALKDALWPAFREFGGELLHNRILAFEEAAKADQNAYIDIVSIKYGCNLDNSYLPGLVIGKLPISGEGGDGAFINSTQIQTDHLYGEAHQGVQALRAEIEQERNRPIE
jgi:hypothetical protein